MTLKDAPGVTASSPALETGTSRHQSVALKLLLERLRQGSRSRVLDLGSAVGANVTFLSQYSCKLYIADLFASLGAATGRIRLTDSLVADLLHQQLLARDPTPCDLVLAWDLLNYLNPEELEILSRHLVRHCQRDSVLFAMISTRKRIPERPLVFKIVDPCALVYENPSSLFRASPRYKEPDLGRHLPDFAVETSFLLRNGVQEYLLSPRGVPGMAHS